MPKVEASRLFYHVDGVTMVPIANLDRANAEIERVTKQRDALAVAFAEEAEDTNILDRIRRVVGLIVHPDGAVTEIGHGD